MSELARYVPAEGVYRDILTGEIAGTVTPPEPPTSRDSLVLGEYWPDATTTGPLPGTNFTVINDPFDFTVAGAVYDGYDFRNVINFRAFDVELKNCIVRGNPVGAFRTGGVTGHTSLGGGLGRAKFTDTKFIQAVPNLWTNGVVVGSFTLLRCEVNGWVDGIGLTGAQTGTTIHQSWIHNGYWGSWTPGDPNFPGQTDGQTHNDAIQIHRGKNISIRGNRIGGTPNYNDPNAGDDYHNACIMLSQEVGSSQADKIEHVWIEDNLFEGGTSGINIAPKNGNTFPTVYIRRNEFVRRVAPPTPRYIIRNGTTAVIEDNVYSDTKLPIPLN